MEGCSKTNAGAASGLPDDPLVEIISRVPAKSVCRFKCVSKAWRDLIAHPDHRKKLRQAMQGLFVQRAEVSEADRTKLARFSFSFFDLTVRSVPLDIDPFSFLTEMTGIETYCMDSCNGLVLFGHRQDPSHKSPGGYTVCNTTTKQWSAMPACGSRQAISHTYLAFDPAVSPHFHLVQFQMPDLSEEIVSLHVYSSETRTWSQNQIDEQQEQGQLEGWHHQFILVAFDPQGAFVNGFLHLVVWDSDVVWGLDAVQHILAVDVQGKARRMITAPGMADGRHVHGFICFLGKSQGHLYCMTDDESQKKISIWVLQDYDAQEWMLKNTVNSLDILGERQFKTQFQVVDIHQDCNVVFFFRTWTHELIAYNMDRKEVSVIATFEVRKFRPNFAHYIPYFSELPALTNKY